MATRHHLGTMLDWRNGCGAFLDYTMSGDLDTEWTAILYYADGTVLQRKCLNPALAVIGTKEINRDLPLEVPPEANPIVRIHFVAPEWFPNRVRGIGRNPVSISAEEKQDIQRQHIGSEWNHPVRRTSNDPGF